MLICISKAANFVMSPLYCFRGKQWKKIESAGKHICSAAGAGPQHSEHVPQQPVPTADLKATQAMSNGMALLGYIYISKLCRAMAVGLWSKTVGAEDPAPSVRKFQGLRIMLAAILVHVFQLSTVQREAWSCPSRPHLSTTGIKAQWEGTIRRFTSKLIHDLKHLFRHSHLLPTYSLGLSGCFIRLLSYSSTNLSPPYVAESHLLTLTPTASLPALLAWPCPEEKGFFSPDLTEEQHAVSEDTTQASCLYLCLLGT